MIEALPIMMLASLVVLLLLGFPVAFTLAGTALIFASIGYFCEVFYWSDLGFVPLRIFGIMENFTLVAVPLFVFMGISLESSGVSERLLNTVTRIFNKGHSSMAAAVVLVGAVLAASTGIVGASVITMGVLALPAMLKEGYNKSFTAGTIAASGTLGQIIPPSIVLVLLGDMMNIDVGDVFKGAFTPGLILVGSYLAYILIASSFFPKHIKTTKRQTADRAPPPNFIELIKALLPPLVLIVVVLGSILFGLASPTEAAGCGAFGALMIQCFTSRKTIFTVMKKTTTITCMVFSILLCAQFFGVVFRGLYGDEFITDAIGSMGLDSQWILFGIMVTLFLLGFFLDFLEICFIILPIVLPIIESLQVPAEWVAIMIAINLQTSFLTPPFGFSLFYLKGVTKNLVETKDIYIGVLPFVALQITVLALVAFFPNLVLWAF